MSWQDVETYVRRSLDMIIQLKRGPDGRTIDRVLLAS